MSCPREPNRPFFHFGNPFRMISPKGSQLSPKLISLLNTFEATLSERLEKLVPKDKGDILSLSWMKLAMESLSEIHCDINNLMTELDLPVADWDEKWMDVYLDISVKLLDISNAFTSELTRLNQGHLMLQYVLHKLESDTPEQFTRASSSLDGWKQHISSKNPRIETCSPILGKMDLEARGLQPNVKAVLLAKLREYKSDLNNVKSEVKRIASGNLNAAARDELLESGMADALTASADQRSRLMTTTERLNQSSGRIKDSRRTMIETEELGVSILHDLHSQRQALLHANNTLHGVDDNIGKSKRIMTAMSRRMSRNKWIIGVIIVVLVIAIALVLYFKLVK